MSKRSRKRNQRPRRRRMALRLAVPLVCLAAVAIAVATLRSRARRATPEEPAAPPTAAETSDEAAATPDSCRSCHETEHEKWSQSQHAHANRLFDPAVDAAAFEPTRTVKFGSVSSTIRRREDRFEVRTLGPDGETHAYQPVAVIGITPLLQWLIEFPGGRLQVLDLAFDPINKEWFNVFGEEDRKPDEWGFWAQRGMNWNSQCAYCHMTHLKKGYDAETDTYQTTWEAEGLTCAQCHGPMPGHAQEFAARPYPEVTSRTPEQAMQMCAGCHARREELTGRFDLGDSFFDHYRLTLVNAPGIYYPDGQVRDEDYEFGSLMLSRMGLKGVTCLHCHDPHSGKTIMPVEDNSLCLQCHGGSKWNGAKKMDPLEHGHHKPDSEGSQCVGCHMPITKYMVRDPRRDHGFTWPDPVLTKELGIPNACNRCHADKSSAWAARWAKRWYGDKLNGLRRRRARAVARAARGDATVVDELVALAASEEVPGWRASLIGLLMPWADRPAVRKELSQSLTDPSPMVRSAAVQALAPLRDARLLLRPLLRDRTRLVRLDAAWALIDEVNRNSGNYADVRAWIRNQSDQPGGAMRQAELALVEQRPADAEKWMRRAVRWDPYTAHFRHLLGRALHANGKLEEAVVAFRAAAKREPNNPEHPFALGLLYGEMNNPKAAAQSLKRATEIDPDYDRAWYNLGLAYAQFDEVSKAIAAIRRAEKLNPRAADYPYARATLHLRQHDTAAARAAARRALEIDPDYEQARRLLAETAKESSSPPAP